jgi:Arc/MetJ family transcription regulator
LLAEAQGLTGVHETSALVHVALKALVERENRPAAGTAGRQRAWLGAGAPAAIGFRWVMAELRSFAARRIDTRPGQERQATCRFTPSPHSSSD